jgi:surface polysaccharide O-acyltransferase-like enzyme
VAIIGVVAIHANGEGLTFPVDSVNFSFSLLWRQVINFSVPLFLAISGYFLARKNIDNYKTYYSFVRKQIPRVYIPCLFWSLIILSIEVFIKGKPLLNQLFQVATFQSFGAYYFVALIIQYYLLLPLLKQLADMKGLFLSAIVSVLVTVLIFYIRYHTDVRLPLIVYAGLFPTWIVFFIYGLFLGSGGKVSWSNQSLFIAIVVSYILSCVESYYLYFQYNQAGDAVTAVKPTSFVYSFFVISYLFKNIGFLKVKFLRCFGEISFGIYLVHLFVLPYASKVLRTVSFIKLQPAYQVMSVFLTLLGCYFIIIFVQKISSKQALKVIGF